MYNIYTTHGHKRTTYSNIAFYICIPIPNRHHTTPISHDLEHLTVVY